MTPATTAQILQIAASLGRTQKLTVLSLSSDWGRAHNHAAAKRLWWRQQRLVDHKHQTDNCWALTKLGLAVRAHLQQGAAA